MSINRNLSRGLTLQILFELDINNNFSIKDEALKEIVNRTLSEYSSESDGEYILFLLNTIRERLSTIDDIISRAAPEWPLEKINLTDRNILRIGLAELLFNSEDVPPKVAIDEAIELSKKYSGDQSHKFINGVLGNIYKEMGEPRKEEVAKKKLNLQTINLAGGLVYSIFEDKIFIAFIHDIFKFWTLPKGKLEEGEDLRVGAVRKIKEEIGVNAVIKDVLKENTYIGNLVKENQENKEKDPEKNKGEKVKKHVHYFLAEAKYEPLKMEKDSTGITEVKWFSLDQIENLKIYDDIKSIIAIAVNKIQKMYEDR